MPELTWPILTVSYRDKRYEWEYSDVKQKSLREVIASFRDHVNLTDLSEFRVRCLPSETSFGSDTVFAEILERLRDGEQLEIYDNDGSLIHCCSILVEAGFFDQQSVLDISSKAKYQPTLSETSRVLRVRRVGSLTTHGEVNYKAKVITITNDVVQIPQNMLPLLRDNLENDSTLKWINRFLGLFLGAFLSALVSLQDSNLKPEFRAALWVVIVLSFITAVIFVGLEVLVKKKRAKLLEPLMTDLSSEVEPDDSTGKDI